jgi:hypothetical protein
MKPKAKVIYPSYYLTTGTDSGGNPMFYPKTVFYDNGYKYVLKLIGNPYPKVIDVIAEHFMKNNLCANQEAAVENAIHAMELVYRSFASMTEKWEAPFKIVSTKDEKATPQNSRSETWE